MAERSSIERYWGPAAGAEAEVETRVVVRSASKALYGAGMGYTVVPRVDQARANRSTQTRVESSPVLMYAPWRLGFRIGGIPVKAFRTSNPAGGGHPIPKEAPDHPAYSLLRRPNEILTRPLLVSGTVASMVMFGKIGWWKDRDALGRVRQLWPIPGSMIKPVPDPKALISRYSLAVPGQPVQPLRVEDVCYFRLMPDPNNWIDGWSPLQSLFAAGDVSEGAAGAWQEIFRTGVLQRLWVKLKDRVDDEVAFARLEAQIEKMAGSRGGIPLLEDDAELNTAGDGPNKELLQAAWDWAVRLVEWMFGLAGDRHDFYAEVVAPIADAIEQELERSLFSEWPDDPAYPQFMYRSILIGTPKEQAEYWQTSIQSGQATINDSRVAQDREPQDGGDLSYIPLNLQAAAGPGMAGGPAPLTAGPTPKKGSSDGLGGSEGKGTNPSAGDGIGAKAEGAVDAMNRRLRAGRHENWGKIRAGVVAPHASALTRRLRGVLKTEVAAIRDLLAPVQRDRLKALRAGFEAPLPPMDDLMAALAASEPDIAGVIAQYMAQTARGASGAAAEFMGSTERQEVLSSVFGLINDRSALVAQRFTDYRARGLRNTILAWSSLGNEAAGVAGDAAVRDLAELIGAWGEQAAHYVDGIARTESAFAFERAAMVTWSDAGVSVVDFVFGGGPCRTGVCEDQAAASPMVMGTGLDNVGATFDGTDSPPLHPGCSCYLVPSEVQDLSKLPLSPLEDVAAAVAQEEPFAARWSQAAESKADQFLRAGRSSAQMKNPLQAQAMKGKINDELMRRLSGNEEFMTWFRANGFQASYQGRTVDDLSEALDKLVRQWAATSGDSNPSAVASQIAAQAEFGLEGKASLWWSEDIVRSATELYARNEVFLRTALRAMYDWTQEQFAEAGITEVALARGQGMANTGLDLVARATRSELLLQPMSSFASATRVAQEFVLGWDGGESAAVIKTTVPVSRILSMCRTGFGCLHEHEFVVLASDGRVILEWV